jgi:hypothetical protein
MRMWFWLEAMSFPASKNFLLVAIVLVAFAGCQTFKGRSGSDAGFFVGLGNTDFEQSAKYRNYKGDPRVLIGVLESKGATCGRGVTLSSGEKREGMQCYYVYCVNGRPEGNQWTVNGQSGALSALSLQGISLGAPFDSVCRDEQVLAIQKRLASGELKGKIRETKSTYEGDRPTPYLLVDGENSNGTQ